jgi:hypothetical protein
MLDFSAREREDWQEAGYEFCFEILRKLCYKQLEKKEENKADNKTRFLYMY